MFKLLGKTIGALLIVALISLIAIIFVPDNAIKEIKEYSNSVYEQIISPQAEQTELPESGTNDK